MKNFCLKAVLALGFLSTFAASAHAQQATYSGSVTIDYGTLSSIVANGGSTSQANLSPFATFGVGSGQIIPTKGKSRRFLAT